MAERKQLAKTEDNTPATVHAEVPDFLKGHQNDQRGSEEVGAEDLVIPRVDLIQGLSKVRKKTDPNYIEGAEEGMFYNVVTRYLYGEKVNVVPVYFQKQYLLWRDADLGGGFGGAHHSHAEAEGARQAQENPEEWEVVDTPTHYCLVLHDDGSTEEAVVSLAKTKAKASRYLNSLVRINGGPRFSRVYQLKGVPEQNSKGQDYYSVQVANVGYVSKELFDQASRLYETIKNGGVRVDQGEEVVAEGTGYPGEEDGEI